MVLTHATNHTYSHPFPTVTLAYFLRYSSPHLNPFATHVLSTDTISQHVEPSTNRLHTTRLHVKKSRIPAAVLKLLPASMGGGPNTKEKSAYILETSVVDINEGWMRSESRNLDHVSVLSVIEKQLYTETHGPSAPASPTFLDLASTTAPCSSGATDVNTATIFRSRVGERIRDRFNGVQLQPPAAQEEQGGWLAGLGAHGIQRSIESIASSRTENQHGKSREGMRMILERIRLSGVMGVLELRRAAQQSGLNIA